MAILCVIFGYFLGAIPFGLYLARYVFQIDLRSHGSGNIGATNVARTCGFKWGVITLILDILKGCLPVSLCVWLGLDIFWTSLCAFVAALGHTFSCFLNFHGGKAVSASIGAFIPLTFIPLLLSAICCLVVIAISGFVSLGSLTLWLVLPLILLIGGNFIGYAEWLNWLPLSLAIAILIIFNHRENIQRLRLGTEKSWRKSKN